MVHLQPYSPTDSGEDQDAPHPRRLPTPAMADLLFSSLDDPNARQTQTGAEPMNASRRLAAPPFCSSS